MSLLGRGDFCDPAEAERLRATVLLDLGRTKDAAALLPRVAAHHPEAAKELLAEVERRTRARTAEELGRARDKVREALTGPSDGRARLLLEAWELDPPNGGALVEAGQLEIAEADRADDSRRAEAVERRRRGARLLERGIAELEEEAGVTAHAGIAAPPTCGGHFTNYLTANWLDDSLHVVVACTEGSVVLRLVRGAPPVRVAQLGGAYEVDRARLPRLKFVRSDAVEAFAALSASAAARTFRAEADPDRSERVHVVATETKSPRVVWSTTVDVERGALLSQVLATPDGRWVFVVTARSRFDPGSVRALDAATGRVHLRAAGIGVRVLDDGSIALRGETGIDLYDRDLWRSTKIAAERGDVSPDGRRVVMTKRIEVDESYHPYSPWYRELPRGPDQELGGLLARSTVAPEGIVWPHVSVPVQACEPLATLPGPGERPCSRPRVAIGGRSYDGNDEVPCAVATRGQGRTALCLDPRGPVRALSWKDPALVCRVGPHVLPLRACTHLLDGE